jgi:hypothetical protein
MRILSPVRENVRNFIDTPVLNARQDQFTSTFIEPQQRKSQIQMLLPGTWTSREGYHWLPCARRSLHQTYWPSDSYSHLSVAAQIKV